MNLGTLKETRDENGVISFSGQIRTYSLDLDFRLEGNLNRRNDETSPTHYIIGRGKHGKAFQAGAAWRGKTNAGDSMFTLNFSIPEIWDEEMKFVAFDAKDGSYDIRASRPQEEKKAA